MSCRTLQTSHQLTTTDRMPNSLAITLCTFNEAGNLRLLVEKILTTIPEADVLIVDDSSPDGTGEIADALSRENPQVQVLHRDKKEGLGKATLAAFQHLLEQENYTHLINMDADFSHDPGHLPEIVALSRDYDVVIGSRYIPGGRITGWGWQRHVMSRCINFYSRWLLWLAPKDCSGSYRCYRTEMLNKIDWSKIRATGYAFQEEILYLCQRVGGKMVETPIVFVDRVHGHSKISWKEAILALWVIFRLFVDQLTQRNVQIVQPGQIMVKSNASND